MRDSQLFEQQGYTLEAYRQAVATRLIAQCAGQPGLAIACGSGDYQIHAALDPGAQTKRSHLGAIKAPISTVLDVLHAGG